MLNAVGFKASHLGCAGLVVLAGAFVSALLLGGPPTPPERTTIPADD